MTEPIKRIVQLLSGRQANQHATNQPQSAFFLRPHTVTSAPASFPKNAAEPCSRAHLTADLLLVAADACQPCGRGAAAAWSLKNAPWGSRRQRAGVYRARYAGQTCQGRFSGGRRLVAWCRQVLQHLLLCHRQHVMVQPGPLHPPQGALQSVTASVPCEQSCQRCSHIAESRYFPVRSLLAKYRATAVCAGHPVFPKSQSDHTLKKLK